MICATKNRHTHLEKLVRFFLEQDYTGKHTLLIYNNSVEKLVLGDIKLPENKEIILVNNYLSLETDAPYTNMGDVMQDALTYAYDIGEFDLVSHMDDDDIYLPNHISEGVKGYARGGKMGYKPAQSYFKSAGKLELSANNLEPSIFVGWEYLNQEGYNKDAVTYHQKWLDKLLEHDQISIDKKGIPTLIYDWSGEIPVHKISGNPCAANFDQHTLGSTDVGDGVITPMPQERLQHYYNKKLTHA